MKNHHALVFLLFLSCLFLLIGRVGVAAEVYTVPLTEWGQPDLQGVWNFSSSVPMQRPEQFGDRQFLTEEEVTDSQRERLEVSGTRRPTTTESGIAAFYNDVIWTENKSNGDNVRTSLIVHPPNGRIPPRVKGIEHEPGGQRDTAGQRPVRFAVGGISRDGPEDRGLSERCLVGFNAGPQLTPSVYNNNIQVIQNRDHVVILSEMVHDARIVKLDRGPALNASVGLWSGDSRGHWDGDTLVVVTKNFNGLTQSFDGYGNSTDKVLTERFTRVGPQTLNYEFTIIDPSTFTDKLTVIVPMSNLAGQLFEYACHEGNYGMANMLRASRAREANEVSDRVANIFRGQ